MPPLEVLYEDNHLLAVAKPAGLPTMGVAADRPSLIVEAKAYIKEKRQKPGEVYLGTVSRLDAPVTGVVLFARTSKAAARLTEQFREREVEKTYWALVSGRPIPPAGTCVDWLLHDERHRKVHIASPRSQNAQEARLAYRTLACFGSQTLLEVSLETGRKHQIRVQLARLGHPIVGDQKYGSREPFAPGIALHSRRVTFEHPVKRERTTIEAPLPNAWRKAGVHFDSTSS